MKNKKWKIVVLSIFAFIIIVIAALPSIAKWYIVKNSKELTGRQINIGKLKVNYFTGTVNIIDFTMLEKDNKNSFLAFDTLRINSNPLKMLSSELELEEVYLSGLNVTVSTKKSTFNFQDLIDFHMSSPTEPEEPVDTTQTEFSFLIKSVKLKRGKFLYAEDLGKEVFKYQLSGITLNTKDISSKKDWVNMYSNMLLNNRGELVAELGFNPNNPMDMSVDYNIEHFQLTDLNTYSRYYVGLPILQGDMHYKGNTKIMSNQLVSKNNILINDIELGDKEGGLYSLPLKFALFILTDKNGDIKLDIPVQGNLDDPEVSIGELVWATVKTLITKVASSPGKQLASLIGVNSEDIKTLEFTYGTAGLTRDNKKSLDLLLKLEEKKPGLKIILKYFSDYTLERKQVALLEAKRLFNADNFKRIKDRGDDFLAFLKIPEKSSFNNIVKASTALVGANKIRRIQLGLSRARLNLVKTYLKSQNNSTTIQVIPYYSRSPKNQGSRPIYEINFSD